MIQYYIKEWTMRIVALAILVGALWGCQSLTEQPERPVDFNEHRITSEPEEVEQPLTFLGALRKSCLEFGSFEIEWEGEKEMYECWRVENGGT